MTKSKNLLQTSILAVYSVLLFGLLLQVNFAQNAPAEGEIKITLLVRNEGAPESKEVSHSFTLKSGSDATASTILAKTFEQKVGAKQGYRIRIENSTDQDLAFYVFSLSPDKTCASILPLREYGKTAIANDREVLIEKIKAGAIAISKFRMKAAGEERFAILAAPTEDQLRDIFMTVEFLSGMPTGRIEPTKNKLDLVDSGELHLGGAKGKSETVGGMTITLGHVQSESKQGLRSVDFYTALMSIAECRNQHAIEKDNPYRHARLAWLNNQALAYYQEGNLGGANKNYDASLEILKEIEQDGREYVETRTSIVEANLAMVYATLGDQETAIKKYSRALILLEAVYSRNETSQSEIQRRVVPIYLGLGTSHEASGDIAAAEAWYQKATDIAERQRLIASSGLIYNSLGRVALKQKKYEVAAGHFSSAIAFSEKSGNQVGVASASNNLGGLYVQQENYDFAHNAFLKAEQVFRNVNNRTALATALSNLMFVAQAQDRPVQAIFYGKQAINLLQNVRGDLSAIEKHLQRSFLISRTQTYRFLADLLIGQGRLPEAQHVLDLLKDREYEQVTRGGSAETIPYSKTETAAIAKIENLVPLERERAELQKLLAANGELTAEQNTKLTKINLDIAAANTAFDLALTALARTEASASKRVGEIEGERVLQSLLTELSEKTNSGVVALYTVLGTEEQKDADGKPAKDKLKSKFGWVIMVTESRYTAYPIDVTNLDETVFQFKSALSSNKYDPQTLAKKIYHAIFRQPSPLKKTLEEDLQEYFKSHPDKTLMWSLDGVLRYIPMAALHDGSQYLVQRYRSTVFTGKSLAWLMDEYKNNWKALGLGVSDKRPNFDALPGVKTELYEIVRQSEQSGGILNGTIKLNEEFKRDTFFNVVGAGAYPVVHISSHYSFDSARPENSFLLAGDGNLTFTEIDSRKNLFRKVDLLTLSACDTGVSGNGKEAEGFAYLAQSLGAKSVIASLWKVSDAGTPELMIRFYKLRAANPQMSKGEAFRQAQLEMMGVDPKAKPPEPKAPNATDVRGAKILGGGTESNLPLYDPNGKPKYAHPHYWAPFVLIGNWR